MTHKYFLRLRPASIGTYPLNGFKSHLEGGKHGIVEYDRQLTDAEVLKYELNPFCDASLIGIEKTKPFGKSEIIFKITNVIDNQFLEYSMFYKGKEVEKNKTYAYKFFNDFENIRK